MKIFVKIIFIPVIILISSFSGFSQTYLQKNLLHDSVIYSKELSGAVIAHNLGFGIQYRRSNNITVFKKRFFEFEFVSMKSPKQIRIINPYFYNSKSYVYGKLNSVFFLRGGYGFQHLLNRKPYWGGIEVRYFYSGGASIGIAKPIYLYILNFLSTNYYEYEILTEKYNPDEYFYENIYGRAPFTKGLDEIKFYPGIYLKTGINFEFGVFKSKKTAIEVGSIVEFLPIGVPIMAYIDSQNLFITVYISFSIGKRYN
ncbi:MAG: hypothetical protein K8R41_05565 [Bacteroidales bacterium]|nr:hypothetical protein [Bacteroidales bacterium]